MKIIKNDLLGKGVKIPLKLFFLGLILLTFKITEAQFTVVATGQATTTTSVLPITVNSLYFGKGTSTGTNNLVIGSPTSLSASGSNAGASIAIGVSSLTNLTSGSENFAVGIGAMQLFASGSYNNAFGSGALRGGVGLSNISGNCAFGTYTMENAGNNSSNNSAFGNQALKQIGSGKFNVALGNTAGFYLSGDSNTVAGFGSGYFITGNRNVTLGASAGAANLTSGSANVVIGSGANIPTATASNQLSIQNIIYGFNNSGIGTTVSTGTIGIGIVPVITPASGTYPNSIAKLHVGGTLRIGTVSTGISTGEYLFVDVNGMVSKAVLPAAVGSISSTCSSQYYIPKVNAAGSPNLTCSQIYDNGTNIGIGVVPSGTLAKFEVGGTIKINTVNTIINPTNTYLWRGVDGIINQSAITDIDAFWSLNGNANTVPGVAANQNYLGTRDAQRLVIATNGIERMTVLPNNALGTSGFVGIATQVPSTPLEIRNPLNTRDNYLRITGTAPSIQFFDINVANPNIGRIGLASGANDFLGGALQGDFIVQSLGTGVRTANDQNRLLSNDLILGSGQLRGANGALLQNGFEVMRAVQFQVQANQANQGRLGIGTTSPTAVLDVQCALQNGQGASNIRFQNLTQNTLGPLRQVLIDPNTGYVYMSTAATLGNRPAAAASINQELETKVEQLQDEVKRLRSLVELMISAKPSFTSNQQFNIYPNPATKNIRIEPSTNAKSNATQYAEVRDMLNRLVVSQTLSNKSATINLNKSLANGTYLIVIYEDGNVIQTEKIQIFK